MEILEYKIIEKYIPLLGKLIVISGVFLTFLLLYKDLAYYEFEEKTVDIFYNVPMVFVFFVWIKCKIEEKEIVHLQLVFIDLLVLFFVSVRMFGLMYHSGHVLFLLYSFLTTENKFYQAICVLMMLVTIYFKFFFWSDFITPTVGTIMALFFIRLRNRIKNSL